MVIIISISTSFRGIVIIRILHPSSDRGSSFNNNDNHLLINSGRGNISKRCIIKDEAASMSNTRCNSNKNDNIYKRTEASSSWLLRQRP